jgi:TonB dependent receptor
VKIVRLLLDWKPNDDLKVGVNLNGRTDNSQRQAPQLEGFRFLNPTYINGQPASNLAAHFPNPAYAQFYPAGIEAVLANPIAPGNDQAADWIAGTHPKNDEHFGEGSLRLDYAISDALGLTSLSSYQRFCEIDRHDDAGVNVIQSAGVANGSVKTISQELRLHGVAFENKLNWLTGANYQDDKTYEFDTFQDDTSSSHLTGGAPFSLFSFNFFDNFEAGSADHARTVSAFGNLDYRVLDDVSVHGGIRYTRSDQSFVERAGVNDPGFATFLAVVYNELHGLNPLTTPSYAVTPGCNDIFSATNSLGQIHETLDQSNVPWRVGVDWKVQPEATYLDSKVTSNFFNYAAYTTGPSDTVNFKDEAFPFTPKWSLNYGARYDGDLNGRVSAFVSGNGSYQTQTVAAFGRSDGGPSLAIKAYGLVDLSSGLATSDGKWHFELWGKNVLNKYYWTSAVYVDDTTVRYAGMPATYGLTVHYRY